MRFLGHPPAPLLLPPYPPYPAPPPPCPPRRPVPPSLACSALSQLGPPGDRQVTFEEAVGAVETPVFLPQALGLCCGHAPTLPTCVPCPLPLSSRGGRRSVKIEQSATAVWSESCRFASKHRTSAFDFSIRSGYSAFFLGWCCSRLACNQLLQVRHGVCASQATRKTGACMAFLRWATLQSNPSSAGRAPHLRQPGPRTPFGSGRSGQPQSSLLANFGTPVPNPSSPDKLKAHQENGKLMRYITSFQRTGGLLHLQTRLPRLLEPLPSRSKWPDSLIQYLESMSTKSTQTHPRPWLCSACLCRQSGQRKNSAFLCSGTFFAGAWHRPRGVAAIPR